MKKTLALMFTLIFTIILAASSRWEWGLMDDIGIAINDHRLIAQFGWIKGMAVNLRQSAIADWYWGLFRPAYWVYCATIYLLPPPLVFTLRVVMLAVSIAGPIQWILSTASHFRLSSSQKIWIATITGLLLLANRSLLDGLSFFSLQEHSGLFFIGLGLFLSAPLNVNEPRRPTILVTCLLIASWLKGPFVWGALCVSAIAFHTWKKRVTGIVGFLVGLATLVNLSIWARQGSYTAQATSELHISSFQAPLLAFLKHAALPMALLTTIFLILYATPRKAKIIAPLNNSRFESKIFAFGLLFSGALYLGTLLPWGRSTGYYFAPSVYFTFFGLMQFFVSSGWLQIPSYQNKGLYLTTLGAGLLICLPVFTRGISRAYLRNQTVISIRDWTQALPETNETILVNGEEAASQLNGLLTLRNEHPWKHQFKFTLDAQATSQKTYYYLKLFDAPEPKGLQVCQIVKTFPLASIFTCHLDRPLQTRAD